MTTPMQRRDAVLRAMKDHPISQRRACVLIGVDPKTVRREHPPDNPDIRLEMNKIAEKRRRFGYRRIGVMLERVGMVMNEKKLYRIYREEGLSVRRRRGRKRARGSRTPMPVPLRPNQRWSLDFLSDTFGACRKFRILAVNDDCCRENLCLIADTSISGARVARELDALVRIYAKPACIVSDNGTEFTARPSSNGRTTTKLSGITSTLASRSRTATSSPSTVACAMNASTRRSSTAWLMPAARWLSGATITTTSGRISRWATKPPPKRVGHLSNLTAPRPTRLPPPKPTTIKSKDSRYERGTTGGQVTSFTNAPASSSQPTSASANGHQSSAMPR
jgi:hypothetical protein